MRATASPRSGKIDHELRPDAKQTVADLKHRGLSVSILSGDHRNAVESIGEELDIDAEGDMAPGSKLERLQAWQAAGERVLMVGDGLNDAPSLRAADGAVAIAEGMSGARHHAQAELIGGHLSGLPLLLDAGALLRRTVRGNLFWTLLYNGTALTLATLGLLHPIGAAFAMIASSLAVSVRSLKLANFGANS